MDQAPGWAETPFTRARLRLPADLKEISDRLGFLVDVGLDYRPSNALQPPCPAAKPSASAGYQIGSRLMGVLYVLDEPSIGLHPAICSLVTHPQGCRSGNTVLVVEHDEETIRSADWIVDLGPGAGEHGGEVIATAAGGYPETRAL